MKRRIVCRTLFTLQLAFLLAPRASGYSVLTHEAVVDSVWDTTFKPLLLSRFPDATPDQLRIAHAYAYGGAILQDMGYYPFGSKFFSDLVHYVRSGDFVVNMLKDAQDLNEYAFALGTMAHYAADNIGHPEGVNIVEPLTYKKDRRKFGSRVTYEDNPADHLKTEFGFDVLEVARGNYAPQSYHDFIGFEVSKPLMERAFEDTYCLKLSDVFKDIDLALGTYRHTVSGLLPEMTKAAWVAKKDEIRRTRPGMTERRFIYNLSKASYKREFDGHYEKPGAGARFLAFLFKILPKVGPLKVFALKVPPSRGETIFMKSFNDTVARVRSYGSRIRAGGPPKFEDLNFDIGKPTVQGQYRLADKTYADLLDKLYDKHAQVSDELRANILAFYRDPGRITGSEAIEEFNALRSAQSDVPASPSSPAHSGGLIH